MLGAGARPIQNWDPHLVIFVDRPHPTFTLCLSNDFACILDNYLIWLECTIATNSVATICCLDHFYADIVFTTSFGSLLQLIKAAVPTLLAQSAITIVAFIEHIAILAILVAARLFCARTS